MSLNQTDERELAEQELQIEAQNDKEIQMQLDFDEAVHRVETSPLHQLLGYQNNVNYDESVESSE